MHLREENSFGLPQVLHSGSVSHTRSTTVPRFTRKCILSMYELKQDDLPSRYIRFFGGVVGGLGVH